MMFEYVTTRSRFRRVARVRPRCQRRGLRIVGASMMPSQASRAGRRRTPSGALSISRRRTRVGVAVRVSVDYDSRRSAKRAETASSCGWKSCTAPSAQCVAPGAHCQAGDAACVAPRFCDAFTGEWLRYSHRAGTAGARRCADHDDLHARVESRGPCRGESAGSTLVSSRRMRRAGEQAEQCAIRLRGCRTDGKPAGAVGEVWNGCGSWRHCGLPAAPVLVFCTAGPTNFLTASTALFANDRNSGRSGPPPAWRLQRENENGRVLHIHGR